MNDRLTWRRRWFGRPGELAVTAWHAWRPDATRSVCNMAPHRGNGLPQVSLVRWLADSETTTDFGSCGRWCAKCCRRLGLTVPPPRLPQPIEEVAVEIVGGALDGRRLVLHVVAESPSTIRVLTTRHELPGRSRLVRREEKEPWQ